MVYILVILGALVALVMFVMSMYNKLVSLRNRFKNAFAQIDVQLKRRYDLIPNLIEVAKKYLSHEKDTLLAVVTARNQASAASTKAAQNPADADAMSDLVKSEAALSQSVGGFFALAEAYPDLKANTNMMQLTEELTSTENKISFARQAYNDAVTQYNTQVETFPSNLIAQNFSFKEATLFEVTDAKVKEAVKINFD